MLPENFDNITPEMAKDWLRRAIMELTDEECEWVLKQLEDCYV